MSEEKKKSFFGLRTFANDAKAAQSEQTNKSKPQKTPPIKNPTTSPTNKGAADFLNQFPETKEPEPMAQKKIIIPETEMGRSISKINTIAGTSILEGSDAFDHEVEGVIVTDHKTKRHRLIPSILTATKDSALEVKKTIQAQQEPKYLVPKAETRLETITEATKNTHRVPDEDFSKVVTKLSSIARDLPDSLRKIKDRSEIVPPPKNTYGNKERTNEAKNIRWDSEISETITKEDVKDELNKSELPVTKKNEVSGTPQPSIETLTPEPPQPVTKIEKAISTPTTPEPHFTNTKPEQSPQLATEVTEVPAQEATNLESEPPTPPEGEIITDNTTTEITPQTIADDPVKELLLGWKEKILNTPVYALIGGLIFTTFLGVAIALFMFAGLLSPNQNDDSTPMEISIVKKSVSVEYSDDFLTLMSTISAAQNKDSGMRVIHFITSEGEPVLSTEAARVIIEQAGRYSLARSLKEVDIGFTERNLPFMVLIGNNPDLMLAEMLLWEESISKDLVSLFGARNSARFTDEQYDLTGNARVLYQEDSSEQIAYTFVNNNTLIISSDRIEISSVENKLK